MDSREFDITVFGASGFTGQFVALEVLKVCMEGKSINWAVAGRSQEKLKDLLAMLQKETGSATLDDVGVIIADTDDESSLVAMARRTKVLLNCVGPYVFYGEQVVKACVTAGTNYMDVCGEPLFLESMQVKYHKEAEDKGIHIVGSCGFDSVPADVGLEYLREMFPGDLTSAELYINYYGRPKINFGTYASAVNGFGNHSKLKDVRKQIYLEKLNVVGPKLQRRPLVSFSKEEGKYCLPFMGADPSVIRRTQYFQATKYKKIPIQIATYFCMQSIIQLICVVLFGFFLGLLTKFKAGKNLLLKHPELFSFGTVTKDGLTRKEMDERSATITIYGKGFSKQPYTASPDQSVTLRIRMPEAGYVATPIFVVQAGLVTLEEKLPNKGGVLTPGSAFCSTSFVQRLCRHGIEIRMDSQT